MLSDKTRASASAALQLFEFYSERFKSDVTFPCDLALELLSAPGLLQEDESERMDSMGDHYWTEIAKKFLKNCARHALSLMRSIVENYGHRGSVIDSHYSVSSSILNQLLSEHPKDTWAEIADRFNRGEHESFWLREWLSGALHYLPPQVLVDWVAEDVESRAREAANFVPHDLPIDLQSNSFVGQILKNYGNRQDVRESLRNNYLSSSWTGLASERYSGMTHTFEALKKVHTDPNIKKWIREMLDLLERQTKWARIEEERHGY